MLACDVGNAGTRLKRCGENLKPLRLAPSPPTLRPRKHRDLTQRPLLSSLSRALLRPVAIATGKAAVTEGVLIIDAPATSTRFDGLRGDDWVFGVSARTADGAESPISSALPGGQFAPLAP